MRITDAYILARTKRKTRRLRTALVIIVSSLLFAVLFGIAFLAQGMINAGSQVGEVGFNGRNLTSVLPMVSGKFDYVEQYKDAERGMDEELRARGVQVTKKLKSNHEYQTELNKRISQDGAESQERANKAFETRVKTLGDPTAVYHFVPLPVSQVAAYQEDPKTDPQAEQFERETAGGPQGFFGPNGFGEQIEFYSVEKGMVDKQLARGQSFDWQPGQPYPVIISYAYLEKLSGRNLTNLPPAERNKGYKELINKYAGQELTYCYRNSTAQDQLRAVLQYNKSAEKDDPASTRSVDVPICGISDQGTLKRLGIISEADPTGVEPLFPPPKIPAPEANKIKFKIVGFIPSNQAYGGGDFITQMLTGISALPTGPYPGVVPLEVVEADPLLRSVAQIDGSYNFPTLYLDFETKAEQTAFLEHACSGDECMVEGALMMSPFGNITTALNDVIKVVSKVLVIAAFVIMAIAGLMIMITISKVIADSVKEIAVFRSLGARRRDIAQIYYTYGLMLAGNALVVSVVLAAALAYWLTTLYDDKIAQGLIQATGAFDSEIHVVLLGVRPSWMLEIIGALVLAACLGIAVPVLASVRRKLITILREE